MARLAFLIAGLLALRAGAVAAPAAEPPHAAARALTPAEATRRIDSLLDDLWAQSPPAPALAVVITSGAHATLVRVDGVLNAETAAAADRDSAMYIASMTKAYIGLLAAHLDAEGVLDLELSVGEHWPGLALPGDVDAADITLHDLLTHRLPVRNPAIVLGAAYMAPPAPGDYVRLLNAASRPREPGFAYDNLGYNLYAAILERETGKDWKTWLDEVVFTPLGMSRTSGNTSDIPADAISFSHQQTAEGWAVIPYKPDAIMQSAGGLVTSANDVATWLIASTVRSAPGLTPADFDEAQRRQVDYDPDVRDGCDGYAYGWNVCDWRGIRVLEHGGGYAGMRSFMALAPDRETGIAVMANSDRMTGWLTRRLSELYMTYLADAAVGDRIATTLPADYERQVGRYADDLAVYEREELARERWGGWGWTPAAHSLSAYAGSYRSNAWPRAVVAVEDDGLRLTVGAYSLHFEPAKRDVFGGKVTPHSDYEHLEFRRSSDGAVDGLVWEKRVYDRVP